MKIGIRKPSLKKMVSSRISIKRAIRHRVGLKAPRGYGWLTSPKRRCIIGFIIEPPLVYLLY